MDFTGEVTLGFVARFWRERGSRRLGCGLPIGQGVHRRKSRCRAYGLDKQLFVQTAPPPQRGRGRGCGAERRQWRMQRGGAPAAVEKIEQASSAKIFSGTARRMGQMRPRLPWGVSVRSTDDALHRSYPALQATERGSSRGNLSPLTRFCLLLAVQKEAPAGQAYSLCLCKRLRDAEGDHKLAPAG